MELFLASKDCLSALANISTIAACLVAIVALWQVYTTQRSTRESQRVELFLKFNQLNIDQGLTSTSQSDHWYNNSKFAITESLFEIAPRSGSWRSTVRWMLEWQRDFIREGGFEVKSYSKKFREYCKDNNYELMLNKAVEATPLRPISEGNVI